MLQQGTYYLSTDLGAQFFDDRRSNHLKESKQCNLEYCYLVTQPHIKPIQTTEKVMESRKKAEA